MDVLEDFAGNLQTFIARSRLSYKQIADLSGVPKRTIANWAEGIVKKPHRWQDVVKVAAALHLDETEVTKLLLSAGHRSVHELRQFVNEEDRALLSIWYGSTVYEYLHQLKPPPPDFIGREAELNMVKEAIEQREIRIIGIFGMGGIGKTALALTIADSLLQEFANAQIQLDLKGTSREPLTEIEVMDYVIRSFNREFKRPESEVELKAIYRSNLQGLKTILLFDNLIDGKHIADLIPPPESVMILTSRQYFSLPGMVDIHLKTLSPDEARSLLLFIAPRIGTNANDIARLCGYLPLALRLAGSALAGWVNIDPREYALWLSETKNRLNVIDSSLRMSPESLGIEPSLQLSYDLLNEETQKLWSMFAIFPGTFDRAAVSNLWDFDPNITLILLSDLVIKCMVEWNPTTQRYNLHDLARIFADNYLSETSRAASQERLARHYVQALRSIEDLFDRGGDDLTASLNLFDLEWPNIQTGLEWARAQAEDIGASLGSDYLKTESRLLNIRLAPRERVFWFDFGLACARKLGKREDEASHLKNLGIAFLELGELQRSIEASSAALELSRELGNRRSEGSILGNLGLAYNAKGDFHRALEYFQKHLDIAREICDLFGQGNALGNIGMAYKNLGKPFDALPYHDEALVIARMTGDRPGEGATLNDMANAFFEARDFQQAITSYNQALDIFIEVGDRKNESNAFGNLGLVYMELGDQQKAIDFFEKALVIDREIGNRVGEEITLCNLGDLYSDLGDPQTAIRFCEKAVAIAKEVGDRYGEAEAQANWSKALDLLGKRDQAIDYSENALGILEYLGIEDSLVIKLRDRLTDWKNTR